jgi:hypothetical protein
MIRNDPAKYLRRSHFGTLVGPQRVREPKTSKRRAKKFDAALILAYGGYIDFRS